MVYIQNVKVPPNKILNFSLNNFSGGINNRSNILKDNECTDMLNMSFTNDSIIEKRLGTKTYDDFKINGKITFIDTFKPYNESDHLIRATESEVYFDEELVAYVSGTISGVNYKGKYFFTDGSAVFIYGKFPTTENTYVKIDGKADANFCLMILQPPPTDYVPLDNTHKQGVTRYNFTNRTISYEPCAQELADTYKEGNVIPDSMKYIVVYKNRLVMAGNEKADDTLYISDVDNPYYFPAVLTLQLPANSDKITSLKLFDDALIIGRAREAYALHGDTNHLEYGTPFTLQRLNMHMGFVSNVSCDVVNDNLYFLSPDMNIYTLLTSKYTADVIPVKLINEQLLLNNDPFLLTFDDFQNAVTFFHNEMWYCSIGSIVLVYSTRFNSWTKYDHIDAHSFYRLDDGRMIWGTSDGRLFTWGEDYFDDGLPYHAYWLSKYFDMNDANSYKHFRDFFLVAHTFEKFVSDINVQFEIDYVNINKIFTVKNEISTFGITKFGDRFISRNINASLPLTIGQRGRNIRILVSNSYATSLSVETFDDLPTVLNKVEGMLVHVNEDNTFYAYHDHEWVFKDAVGLNQPMRVYEINGEFEFRGKR